MAVRTFKKVPGISPLKGFGGYVGMIDPKLGIYIYYSIWSIGAINGSWRSQAYRSIYTSKRGLVWL